MRKRFQDKLILSAALLLISVFVIHAEEANTRNSTQTSNTKTATPQKKQKYVFAHYMTCLAMGKNIAMQEIDLAQRHNIDGFALNSLTWGAWDKKNDTWTLGGHGNGAQTLYDAAAEMKSDFKLFNSIDVNGSFPSIGRAMLDMAERYKDHPNQFYFDNRLFLSAWYGTPQIFSDGCKLIEQKNIPLAFVPYTNNARHVMAHSPRTVNNFLENQSHMAGWFYFTCDGSVNDMLRNNAIGARTCQFRNKIYMAGVVPAYNSPNVRDMNGMEGYCALWEGLINDGADLVEIVTWNDYNEDSNLMTMRFQNGEGREYFDRDESYLDVTAYYSAWFKSGIRPQIRQDKIFFTYRNRPTWLTKAWDWRNDKWIDFTQTKNDGLPFDQIHDDVKNYVYLTAFLTSPADVEITLSDKDKKVHFPAGINHTRIPLDAGAPEVRLMRDGKELAKVNGRKQIVTEATKLNSPHGYHLLNRTWANALAVGKGMTLSAKDATVNNTAKLTGEGNTAAIENIEKDGSGSTWDIDNLDTGTYNIRITYSNPAQEEARLTMQANGPARGPRQYPYYIPVFFPPTEKGKTATTSFFWSLYKDTTYIDISWRNGVGGAPVQKEKNPVYNDYGKVRIEKIELIPVLPTEIPTGEKDIKQEFKPIPGGTFTMGGNVTNSDESPAHEVELSPFAMSIHEVTNKAFEEYDATHRKWRDEYSWRDDEPVIYVSWTDAAKYCNWLSGKYGLTPAYKFNPKTGSCEYVKEANGFRLPTEAEWEYVASGRGENRMYPWGNSPLKPNVNGNFEGKKSLIPDARLRSQNAMGVTVVGSYPEGASRDGIMDMAGNVSEWCNDQFHLYSAEKQKDPSPQQPSNYRVIRGGSWGYYGCTQRTKDREYNNQNYPGYIYIGFRIVLPNRGWNKLNNTK